MQQEAASTVATHCMVKDDNCRWSSLTALTLISRNYTLGRSSHGWGSARGAVLMPILRCLQTSDDPLVGFPVWVTQSVCLCLLLWVCWTITSDIPMTYHVLWRAGKVGDIDRSWFCSLIFFNWFFWLKNECLFKSFSIGMNSFCSMRCNWTLWVSNNSQTIDGKK